MSEPKIRLSQVSPSASGNDRITGNVTITDSVNVATANITTLVTGNALTLSTGTASNGNIIFSANGTEDMRIVANGFVGIGTTNPAAVLHVAGGSIRMDQDVALRAAGNWLIGQESAANLISIGSSGVTNDIRFDSSTAAGVVMFKSGGNVGIGTTNPGRKFHIMDATSPHVRLHWSGSAAAGNKGLIEFTHNRISEGNIELLGYIQGVAEDNQSAGGIRFVSRNNSDVETLRITSGGNVGIGRTNPGNFDSLGFGDSILDVNGVIQIRGDATNGIAVINMGGDTYRKGAIYTSVGTSDPYMAFGVGSNGSNSNSAERVRIVSNGFIGIATTNPGSPIHIVSPVDSAIKFEKSSGWNYMEFITGGSRRSYMGVDSSSNPIIGSDSGSNPIRLVGAPVLKPNQPVFHAYGVTGGTFASGSTWIFPTASVNIGSHYNTSNGRFTAPVAGTYLFYWTNIGGNVDSVWRYYIYRNGGYVNGSLQLRLDTGASGSEYGTSATMLVTITLAVSDYITIYYVSDTGTASYPGSNDASNPYPNFGGYLIG